MTTSRRRLGWALALALAGACDAPPPSDGGLADAGDCEPDFSYLDASFASQGTYSSAPEDTPFARPEGSLLVVEIRLYPWETAAPRQVWLTTTPLRLRLRWMLGDRYPSDGAVLHQAFINGTQVELAPGQYTASAAIEGGLVSEELTFEPERFPVGLSTLHVYGRLSQGPLSGAEAPSVFAVAVFRETTDLVTGLSDTPGHRAGVYERGYGTRLRHREFGTRLLLVNERPPDGRLPIEIHVQSPSRIRDCPDATDTVIIVATLDGRAIDLAPFGPMIVATVRSDEARIFDVDIEDLPIDGELHRFEVLELGGTGRPMLDSRGWFTPWVQTGVPVSQIEWE